MKYFLSLAILLCTLKTVQAQCKANILTAIADNSTATNYTILYDANSNIEAISNNLDYVQFMYDELGNNKQQLKSALVYKNAQLYRTFNINFNEANQINSISVLDSVKNKYGKLANIDTVLHTKFFYKNKKLDYVQFEEGLWDGFSNNLKPFNKLSAIKYSKDKNAKIDINSLIQDGSDVLSVRMHCKNQFANNNNLPYYFFMLSYIPKERNLMDKVMYSLVQKQQIAEMSFVYNGTKYPSLLTNQEAFTYNNTTLLRNASFKAVNTSLANGVMKSEPHLYNIALNYDCGSFDYANTTSICDETITPTDLEIPTKKPIRTPKDVIKPKTPTKVQAIKTDKTKLNTIRKG